MPRIIVHRPPMENEKDPRIITPIPKELLARIDDYRFDERLPSRAEAIRRLIEVGLQTMKPRAKRKGA
jgi:metal-responsive CopG/Arc/MetJ family transcriptional regulator